MDEMDTIVAETEEENEEEGDKVEKKWGEVETQQCMSHRPVIFPQHKNTGLKRPMKIETVCYSSMFALLMPIVWFLVCDMKISQRYIAFLS